MNASSSSGGITRRSLHFSKDGKRLAFSARMGKEWTAVIDGTEQGGMYQKIYGVGFNPDGSRFAFAAKGKDGALCVVDGKPGTPYKDVTGPRFSSDGRHLAYTAQKGKQWVMVADGVESAPFDEIRRLHFTPETNRLVYIATRGKEYLLVTDGKEHPLPSVKEIYAIAGFMPHTEEPVLAVWDGDNSRLLLGKTEGPLADILAPPIQCDDTCQHFVYATARANNPTWKTERAFGQVVIGGKGGREYEAAPVESSAKGCLRAMNGSQLRLQQGLVPEITLHTHGVSMPVVTKDFQHVAYAARRGNSDFTVVLDGVEGPRMDAIPCGPRYSPEGKLYYLGVQDSKAIMIADGKKTVETPLPSGGWDERGGCIGPDFGDGGHYVYVVTQRDGTQFIADGAVSKLRVFLVISGPWTQVNANGFHFAYVAKPQPKKPECVAVVDGKESKTYNDIWVGTVKWAGDGILTYVARQGQKLLKVTQTVPPNVPASN